VIESLLAVQECDTHPRSVVAEGVWEATIRALRDDEHNVIRHSKLYGRTCLHYAAGNLELTTLLFSIPGIYINAADRFGFTPFDYGLNQEQNEYLWLFLKDSRFELSLTKHFCGSKRQQTLV
jgi:ankyrin repeat protein